jgi:sugar phosphate isomerase/epimerase
LAAIDHVGRPDFRLLIDTMHVLRSGSTPDDVAALDPKLIAYVQLSDAPLAPRFDSYMEEAMFERMVPGEGELPLRELLAVLPDGLVISLEVPQRSLAEAGIGPEARLGHCVEATRALLAEVR